MPDAVRSSMLERVLQLLIVLTVVTAVLAAGAILDWLDEARLARWLALGSLAAVALVYAARAPGVRRLGAPHLLAGGFVALALVSTAWSPDPGLTFARAASLGLLLAACAAVALGAAGRLRSLRRVVDAVAVATAVVAVGGLLVLALARDRAVQPASAQEPARYQGLGGGPNTASMVLGVGLPLAAYLAGEARTRAGRAAAAALGLLLLGSIVASGSRGALVAAFAGLMAYALLAPPAWRRRLLAVAAVAALLVASALLARVPQPDPNVPALPGTSLPPPAAPPAPGYLDANVLWRLQEDVGRPPYGEVPEDTTRSLLGLSGRTQAWRGAVGLAADRAFVGYGFGTENVVFVDRYLAHGSNSPESSYVGLFLQLGVAGLVVFAALLATLLAGARRAFLRPAHPASRLAAACTGALVAGLVLALTQSFVYAAGNNASAAVWLCAFLIPAAGASVDAAGE